MIRISVIKVPPSRSIMCDSLKDYLGWNPGDKVLERKAMVEHRLALMELKKAVAVARNLFCSWARFRDCSNLLVGLSIATQVNHCN